MYANNIHTVIKIYVIFSQLHGMKLALSVDHNPSKQLESLNSGYQFSDYLEIYSG